MRIGIYDPYLDDLGGGEKYMMTIAQCLSKNNNVEVFWDNQEDLRILTQRFSINFSSIKLVSNIFSKNISTLKRFWETKKYDAIIFLSDGSIPLVYPKLFIHIQQPLSQMQNASFVDKIKLSRVRTFFCNSNFTKSFIDDKFSIKSTVVYPPVSILPKKVNKENIILHVGRFRVKNVKSQDYKKQSLMIKIFKEMIDEGLKNWEFVLAVSIQEKDSYDFNKMKEDAKGYPIRFLINKSNNDLWDIYSKAKIYWHATGFGESLDLHPELAEHFGISTVEAMGAGAVPVVINAGGQREIVNDGQNGFVWDSLEEFKKKTIKLIEDKNLLNEMSKNAINSSLKYGEQDFCNNINKLINT